MTDIVERLRKPSGIGEPMDHMAMEQAAAEIERLRAVRFAKAYADDEIERLRAAIVQIYYANDDTSRIRDIARAALGEARP